MKNDICGQCGATKHAGPTNYADFSDNAGWTTCNRTHAELALSCPSNPYVNGGFGFHVHGICGEMLHTDLLGPRLHLVANVLWELANELHWGPTCLTGGWKLRVNRQLSLAFASFKSWCSANKVSTRLTELSVNLISMYTLSDYPEMRCKGYTAAMLSCWLYHECASDLSDTHTNVHALLH